MTVTHECLHVVFAMVRECFFLYLQHPRERAPSSPRTVQCRGSSLCNLTSHHSLCNVYILLWNLKHEKVLIPTNKDRSILSTLSTLLCAWEADLYGLYQFSCPLDTGWFSQWEDQGIEDERRMRSRALFPWLPPFWTMIESYCISFIKVPSTCHVAFSTQL